MAKQKKYFSVKIERAIWDKAHTKILRKEQTDIRVQAKSRKKAIESLGVCVILCVNKCY